MDTTEQELKELEKKSSALLENLTGGQIQEVLDGLIFQAVYPILEHSNLFDTQIVYILSIVTKNRKRKLSALPREEFISILCQYLVTSDPERKLFLLETAKIERGLIYNFVVNVLEKIKPYVPVYLKWVTTKDAADKLRLSQKLQIFAKDCGLPADYLYTVYQQSSDFLELAYKFRNSIVNNYIRYSYKQAKIYCASKTNTFDFQDVWHNFLAAVTKAIDKYDCSKGALTSYIKWWILNVQTTSSTDHGHEYGLAYSIPQMQRKNLALKNSSKQANFSLSLDTILSSENGDAVLNDYTTGDNGLEDILEKDQEADIIKYLIKRADSKLGLARLYLDIEEFFSKKELRKMRKITREQLHPKTVKKTSNLSKETKREIRSNKA
jgi:hypothetical protein